MTGTEELRERDEGADERAGRRRLALPLQQDGMEPRPPGSEEVRLEAVPDVDRPFLRGVCLCDRSRKDPAVRFLRTAVEGIRERLEDRRGTGVPQRLPEAGRRGR